MLPSILAAISVTGRKNKQIATDCERTSAHITEWFSGRCHIPLRMRKRLCDAIGADIDWQAYEAEFQAMQAGRRKRPEAEAEATPPAPQEMPRPAPQIAQKGPSIAAAPPPPPKAQTRPKAPPSAAAPQGGLFGFLKSIPATTEKGIFDFD